MASPLMNQSVAQAGDMQTASELSMWIEQNWLEPPIFLSRILHGIAWFPCPWACLTKIYSQYLICTLLFYNLRRGRWNSIMVTVYICHAGHPGSSPVWFACLRKVEFYQNVMNWMPAVRKVEFYQVLFACSHQCWWMVHQRLSICCHVCVIMHVKDP